MSKTRFSGKNNFSTILLKKIPLIFLLLGHYIQTQGQTTYKNEGFETLTRIRGEDGKVLDHYGIWIDGGSNAYVKNTEKYSGNQSFAIAKGNDPEKPYYGSIYTKQLDFSKTTTGIVLFNYLITNSLGNLDPTGSFALEISTDGGESFKALRTFNMASETVIKTTKSAWFASCKSKCLAFPPCVLGCDNSSNSLTNEETRKYWKSISIEFSGTNLSKMTVLRIKSYLPNTDEVTKIFIDELDIRYTGKAPDLSENTILTTSDSLSGAVSETITQDFNSENDWGIWQDGGRNVYLTHFFALNGNGKPNASAYGVGMRSFFSGKHNGTVGGVDLGFQKPSYSSILTKNLDLTDTKNLGLEFSFVAYNMKVNDPTAAELKAAGNTNLKNIDKESVLGYVPGPDYVEISISTDSGYTYKTVRKLVYGVDFINLVRQNLTVFIPGNFLATDDETDPEAILNTAGLTTTTKIKIQCYSDTDEQQFYIDQIVLKKIGNSDFSKGSPRELTWERYEQTFLYADPTFMDGDTYELINSKLLAPEVYASRSFLDADSDVVEENGEVIPGTFGVVEFSDCSDHSTLTDIPWTEGRRHFSQDFDKDLTRYIFNFHSHLDEDTERCRTIKYDDRMRTEIKTKEDSGEDKKGIEGETHFFAWKMKLPEDFKGSNKFTHLHQIKPVGGEHAGMPTITLTANGEKVDPDTGEQYARPELRIRYAGLSESQVTVETIELDLLKGKWIQFVEKVHFGESDKGRYELLVYDAINGNMENPIYTFESYSLQTWKVGDDHGDSMSDIFVRPKWGIYRSNVEAEKLGDEIVGFTDFIILEVTDFKDGLYGDIKSFAKYIEKITEELDPQDEIPITPGAEVLYVNLDSTTAGTGTQETPFNTIESALAYINIDPLNNTQEFQIIVHGLLTAPEEFVVNSERTAGIIFMLVDSHCEIADATGMIYELTTQSTDDYAGYIELDFIRVAPTNPYSIYPVSSSGDDDICLSGFANPTPIGYLDEDPLLTTVALPSDLPSDSGCVASGIQDHMLVNTLLPVQVMIEGDQIGTYLYILPPSNDQTPDSRYGWETYFNEGLEVKIDGVLVYRLLIREIYQLVQFIPTGSVFWIGNGEAGTEETIPGTPGTTAAKFTVSPNPSNSKVMLAVDNKKGNAEYAIYTINGIQVNSGAIVQETASLSAKQETNNVVNISKLAPGMYIVKIEYDDGTSFNSKFIKN